MIDEKLVIHPDPQPSPDWFLPEGGALPPGWWRERLTLPFRWILWRLRGRPEDRPRLQM
jgi:hypothetical protein